jgi:oligopeptide transport system permease protein
MSMVNQMAKDRDIVSSSDYVLSAQDTKFVQSNSELSDTKFETKQMSFFHDAFRRFAQNKGSVVAGIIILFLLAFSLIVPAVSGQDVVNNEPYYAECLPKNPLFAGTGFWDGTKKVDAPIQQYISYQEKGQLVSGTKRDKDTTNLNSYYTCRYDTYIKGYAYQSFDEETYNALVAYDKTVEAKRRILFPLVDYTTYCETAFTNSFTRDQVEGWYKQNAYASFKVGANKQPLYVLDSSGDAILNADGTFELERIYLKDSFGNYVYSDRTGEAGAYSYACRINFDNYYIKTHGHAPLFILGSDTNGKDLMTRLAIGGRVSLLLGITVSVINFILGAIYGAIEGYYGGVVDLVMERISEILAEVPTTIIFVLFNWYLRNKIPTIVLLFFAFIFVGWLGTAATVRMQFYRFKNQEYVLAARTLGASDARLIVKHIFPNSLGTVVTSSVLMIPGVIFSESSLSYLQIIDLSSSGMTSIGTMLSEAQGAYTTNPNLIIWPALFISLLMICFNMFGNGLRDAFNPTLRGAEE